MKRLVVFLLALMMGLTACTALAAAPSAEDVSYVVVNGQGDIEIVWTDDPNVGDDAGPAAEAMDAQGKGNALDVLPEEIRSQLPEGYTVVNEIRSAKLSGDLSKLANIQKLDVTFKFDTPYTEGEVVYLAIGVAGEAGTEWVLLQGKANADNNVEVTFDHDTLMKIGEKNFAVMAISKA